MKRIWTILAGSALTAATMAQVTVLLTIPFADTRSVGEAEIGYYVTGIERNVSKGYGHFGYAILGVHQRAEIAASTNFNGTDFWGFKVKVLDDKVRKYILSAGFQNIRGGSSDPYVIGRYTLDKVNLHAGWTRNSISRGVFGADMTVNPNVLLAVDHWTGDGGYTWGGFYVPVPKVQGLLANVMVGYPNRRTDGVQHSLGFVYSLKF